MDGSGAAMAETWQVGELALHLREMLRQPQFRSLVVQGELTQYTVAASGHAYFSLKDDDGKLDCVAWKGRTQGFPEDLKEGMQVIVIASLDLYPPQGRLQLQVESLRLLSGLGALEEARRRLISKLAERGALDLLQRPLPSIPQHLVIVTGAASAALADMLRIRDERWPRLRTTVIETVVQGKDSQNMLPRALRAAYSLKPSVVVVGRGGGSPEDLWSFNLEPIIEAILDSPVPIVSAVGHESDHMVSDLVADHRAATPTHAMEMVIPMLGDHQQMLDGYSERLSAALQRGVKRRREKLTSLAARLRTAPLVGLGNAQQSLLMLRNSLSRSADARLQNERRRLEHCQAVLQLTDPEEVLRRGFSLVKRRDGSLLRSRAVAADEEKLVIGFHDGDLMVVPEESD